MSWVTLGRFCQEEVAKDEPLRRKLAAGNRPLRSSAAKLTDGELLDKLRSMGFELDRSGVGNLCAGALSAEEVARPLQRDWEARNPGGGFHVDWIWICLLALWERWWPDKVCLELLDDKIQAGYDRQEQRDLAACAATWLDAWADVLRLCDATGIGSIDEFDDRFPLTQSLYNWLSDVEMELWNAGVNSREFLMARIGLCSEALRRFPGEEQWRIENLRRALAETYFEIGEHCTADELFESWLTADPRWGWGWIGWADCYRGSVKADPDDPHRAGELLLRGYSIHGVRDRADIADRLASWCEDTGRSDEAREWKRQAGSARSAAVHRQPSAGNRARRHGQVPSQRSSMHAIGASWRVSAFCGLARNQLGNQRELHLPGPSPDRLL